ncbi:ARM repeat-containing protein [Xylariaceae sp. FL0016]|nr:ARM repeat-containing protein [Xylariaceae sp. FL0016]
MDDYRFLSQHSPRTEAPMNSLVSPQRNGRPIPQPVSQDPRTSLPRRFTTDSGRVPTLSSISTQRIPEPQEYPTATQYKVQLLEKKKLEYEKLREQKRRFEAEMQKLDQQQRMDEFELAQMQEDLGRGGNGINLTGHQSEPTTPPEYRETNTGFPTMFSRPNRYSTSSLISPPGFLTTRQSRSGSQLTSPQSGALHSRFYDDQMPSRSVPGTRRNSDEDEKEEALRQDPTSHRSTNALNRYSMPVTRSSAHNLYENIDGTNTTGFLFRDEDTSMDSSNLSNLEHSEASFPQLSAQKNNMLSATASTADLAAQVSTEAAATNGWGNISRHRHQQSLSTLNTPRMSTNDSMGSGPLGTSVDVTTPRQYRHSLDQHQMQQMFRDHSGDVTPTNLSPSSTVQSNPPPHKTHSSNEVPTVKNAGGAGINATPSNNAHAAQHFQNHQIKTGRFPQGAIQRHSRELSSDAAAAHAGNFASITSTLQGNTPAFNTNTISQAPVQSPTAANGNSAASPSVGIVSYPPFFGAGYNPNSPNGYHYGMNMLAMNMQNMNMNALGQQGYSGYGAVQQPTVSPRDSQQRIIQQRRAQDNEAMSRYNNLTLDQVGGTIYSMCKDQHGCRYLQKQLENRIPEEVHMIWVETNQHVVELMTDPFGNYLCQKLLEYCNEDERTALIQNAAQDMVRIALNQHGTRALQKMIEFVNTPTQIQLIIGALQDRVVELIQDLNGNHVIQKCLNKLSSQDANFIFEAVGYHCVDVGTHRHGCCVLQRCIDHASGHQKIRLVEMITNNALQLVQDPFGNYVVQYIIDLSEPSFTEPLVKQLSGQIVTLSRHKFSSNVIEKCLRCASDESKDRMVDEILAPGEIMQMLKDSYGNYVVQTALEHSTFMMKHKIIDTIRPLLPSIRGTPYGRRLAAKISQYENQSTNNSGQSTPSDAAQGQISLRSIHNRVMPNNQSMAPPNGNSYGHGFNGGRAPMAYANGGNINGPNGQVPPPQQPRMNGFQGYPGEGQGFF